MEQLIITPLEEEYQTLYIRTTNLEKYYGCPFKYKFEPQKSDSWAPFKYGKIVHTACQWYLLAKKTPVLTEEDEEYNHHLSDTIVALYHKQYPEGMLVKEATQATPEHILPALRLKTYMNVLQEHYKDTQFMLAEFPIELEVHYGKYKLIITGWLDLVTTNWSVVDLKTAGAEWKDESIKKKLQKLIYLYAMYLLTKNEKLYFEYAVLRTDLKREQNVKLQAIKTVVDPEAIEYVLKNIIESYLYSEQHNVWPTKQCDDCRYCGLWPKWNKKCPLFDKAPIWTSGENI